jgi:DNA (cytosine-5)-methyltransferase 1
VVDLFAGCGGLSLGVEEAARTSGRSPRIVLAVEINSKIRDVYRANFPNARVDPVGDVLQLLDGRIGARITAAERKTRTGAGRVDLAVGGPPCQGHSNLNNHTRRDDERNALYLRMVRAAEVFEPASLCIENVPGVQGDRRRVVDVAIARLTKLGYEVDAGVIDLSGLGVPQVRFRHVLLASRSGRPSVLTLAQTHHRSPRPLWWAIGDLAYVAGKTAFETAATLSPRNMFRAQWLLKNDRYDLPNRFRPPCHRDKPDHRYKSMYGRLHWEQPAQTVTTGFGSPGQGRYLHPALPRTLTPHEAARVQFFPDWFDFGEAETRDVLAQCIGNAVPPKLGFAVARHLIALADGIELAIQPETSSSTCGAGAAE